MIVCYSCAHENPDDSRFCTHCGRLLELTQDATPPSPTPKNVTLTYSGEEVPVGELIEGATEPPASLTSAFEREEEDLAATQVDPKPFVRPPPKQVASYRIERQLGEGGMGQIFAATHIEQGHQAALKMLPPLREGDHRARRRLQREARALETLNHPNIVEFYELVEHNQRFALILELLHGETLTQRLQHSPIPTNEALDLAEDLLSALQHAHNHGIVHRDINPNNIFLAQHNPKEEKNAPTQEAWFGDEPVLYKERNYQVKLVDFGLAMLESRSMATTVGTRFKETGTVSYMAPEQINPDHEINERTDLYALGAVLYEVLTGERLMNADNILDIVEAIKKNPPPPLPTEVTDYLPLGFERWLRKLLEKNPTRRHANASEALDQLRQIREGNPPSTSWNFPSLQQIKPLGIGLTLLLLLGLLFHTETRQALTAFLPSFSSSPASAISPLDRNDPDAPPPYFETMRQIPQGWAPLGGMGSQKRAYWKRLPTFWIDSTEVTNEQYQRCVDAKQCRPPQSFASAFQQPKSPVVGVSWDDALHYCRFQKKRLPTSEEWEKAARGWKGKVAPIRSHFFPPQCSDANFGKRAQGLCPQNPGYPTIASRYPNDRSPFGVLQMAGNVREWTATCNRLSRGICAQREVRGGSWKTPRKSLMATHATPLAPQEKQDDLGFRCVWP